MNQLNAFDWVALILVIVGGLNWGLVGLLEFDLVAALFGAVPVIAKTVYTLVGLSAVYLAINVTKLSKKQKDFDFTIEKKDLFFQLGPFIFFKKRTYYLYFSLSFSLAFSNFACPMSLAQDINSKSANSNAAITFKIARQYVAKLDFRYISNFSKGTIFDIS